MKSFNPIKDKSTNSSFNSDVVLVGLDETEVGLKAEESKGTVFTGPDVAVAGGLVGVVADLFDVVVENGLCVVGAAGLCVVGAAGLDVVGAAVC